MSPGTSCDKLSREAKTDSFPFTAILDYPWRQPPREGISMDDPQSHDHPDNHPETVSRNARNGLMLFALYVALYAGFMFLNAFAPERMKQPVLAGVNLAIIYGMGLIVAALVLALVYMQLCKPTRA
jgi:uncharacterized membrane protein (DUF485 family)